MSVLRLVRDDTSTSPDTVAFGSDIAAFANNLRPTTSDMANTLEETLAPSRRFFLFSTC